jgi:hypothetical protein
MWLREAHVVFLSHMESNISHNGNKSVTNYIMGLVHSLPWGQHKRCIPIWPMGCVHTHSRRPVIEGCGSLSRV